MKAVREHQLTVFHIKEDQLTLFSKELKTATNELNLQIKDFQHRRNQLFFTLCGGMDAIEKFLGDFAEVWSVREMGVSEFARVMEVSDDEAKEWYERITQYQNMIMSKSSFESKLVSRFAKLGDVSKLEYLKKHFMDTMAELIQNRIDTLSGREDDFTLWMNRQTEKQDLLLLLSQGESFPDDVSRRLVKFLHES